MSLQSDIRPLDLDSEVRRHPAVIRRIAKDHRVRESTAEEWFREMLRFLDLCAESRTGSMSPPKKVDKAWHTFLLFTRAYEEYCLRRFGAFIHHDPWEGGDESAYDRTWRAARERFGKLNSRIWPVPRKRRGNCAGGVAGGACGSGSDGGSDGGGGGCGGGCGGGGS